MTVFDTSKHLCFWAGPTPQNAGNAGKKKAIIAIARRIFTAIYHILRKGEGYDLSAYRKEDNSPMVRQISQEKAFERLKRMGVVVTDPSPPLRT